MNWWTSRPDPSRGREVLDGIDRFRARLVDDARAQIHSVSEPSDITSIRGSTCLVCGNEIGMTHTPKPTKHGYMHPSCFKRWVKMSVSEQNEIRIMRKTGIKI